MTLATTTAIFLLSAQALLCSSAIAAPPTTGSQPPSRVEPTTIPYGYIGVARTGPRGYCTTSGPSLCTAVARTYVAFWKRTGANKPWKVAYRVASDSPLLFITQPFGHGWQWVYSPNLGLSVVQAHQLSAVTPSSPK